MPFDLLLRGGPLSTGPARRPARRTSPSPATGSSPSATSERSWTATSRPSSMPPGTSSPPGSSTRTGIRTAPLFLDGALDQPPAPGLHDPALGQLRLHVRAADAACQAMLAADLAALGLDPSLDDVRRVPRRRRAAAARAERRVPRRPRHGPQRRARPGQPRARPRPSWPRWSRTSTRRSRPARSASRAGLIYAPGMHAPPDEVAALVAAASRRGRACTRRTCATSRAACSGRSTRRSRPPGGGRAGRAAGAGSRCRTSRRAQGRCGAMAARSSSGSMRPGRRPRRRRRPVPVYRGVDDPRDAPAAGDPRPRPDEIAAPRCATPPPARGSATTRRRGVSGWENVRADPGWDGIVIARSGVAARVERADRSRTLAADAGRRPGRPRARRPRRRPARASTSSSTAWPSPTSRRSCACPGSRSARTPSGRRPGHPILDAGVPHPRTYGSTARVLGRLRARARRPPARDGGREAERRPGGPRRPPRPRPASARAGSRTSWCSTRPTVADLATYERPAAHPAGIRHVLVNGRLAIRDGRETGERPGRLLRRGDDDRRGRGRLRRPPSPSRPSPSRGCPAATSLHAAPLAAGAPAAGDDPPRARRRRLAPARRAARLGSPRAAPSSAFLAEREALDPPPPRPPGGDSRARLDDAAGARRRAPRAVPGRRTGCGSSRRRPALRASRVSRVGADDGDELLVERVARDRRPTAAILEAWFRARARAALDAAIARHGPTRSA